MTIPASYTEWLDIVDGLSESELPCNPSTVAFAVKVAQAYRAEAAIWQGLVERAAKPPVLISTAVSFCVTHGALGHDDGRAWSGCRFRQLFYFENPMDEHTVMWSDEIGRPSEPTEEAIQLFDLADWSGEAG